jgi:hypothetical protein
MMPVLNSLKRTKPRNYMELPQLHRSNGGTINVVNGSGVIPSFDVLGPCSLCPKVSALSIPLHNRCKR